MARRSSSTLRWRSFRPSPQGRYGNTEPRESSNHVSRPPDRHSRPPSGRRRITTAGRHPAAAGSPQPAAAGSPHLIPEEPLGGLPPLPGPEHPSPCLHFGPHQNRTVTHMPYSCLSLLLKQLNVAKTFIFV
ncbi:hypothetical protein AMECASPLE_032557 [Ameca splendens]|uniref:Uncharacterized protein n=1 Tax=Ameca splendens TaxID=208324 RepID=A0ABV0Z651_9TELE